MSNFAIGICVRTEIKVSDRGIKWCRAFHKCDKRQTYSYRSMVCGSDLEAHASALNYWMLRFTGSSDTRFTAAYKVVARGSDNHGYYWILQPTEYFT